MVCLFYLLTSTRSGRIFKFMVYFLGIFMYNSSVRTKQREEVDVMNNMKTVTVNGIDLTELQVAFLEGDITELTYPSERMNELEELSLFLDGRLILNKIKYNKNTDEVKLITFSEYTDYETYDCMLEDLEGELLFTPFNKAENKVVSRAEMIREVGLKSFFCFMTPKEMQAVRWDLMAYFLNDIEFTVLVDKGVAIMGLRD